MNDLALAYLNKLEEHIYKERQGVIFDVEAGGIFAHQNLFAYSYGTFTSSGKLDVKTRFQKPGKLNKSKWSVFSLDLFEKTKASVPGLAEAYSRKSQAVPLYDFSKTLPQDIKSVFGIKTTNKPAILIGHNIRFDIAATLSEAGFEPVSEAFKQAGFEFNTSPIELTKLPAKTRVEIFQNLKNYDPLFEARTYLGNLYSKLEAGKSVVVDTLHLAQMALGATVKTVGVKALEKAGVKFRGDVFTGTSLDVIGRALGLGATGHDVTDIERTQKVLNWAISTLREAFRGNISPKNLEVVKYILHNQEAIAKANLTKHIATIAAYKIEHEKGWIYKSFGPQDIVYASPNAQYYSLQQVAINPETGVAEKAVRAKPKFVSSLDEVFQEAFSLSPEGLYTKSYGITQDEMKQIFYEQYKLLNKYRSRKAMWRHVDAITNMDKILQSLPSGGIRRAAENTETLLKTSKSILTNRKMWGLIGLGAIAYYALSANQSERKQATERNIQSIRRISGKDDAYNTIEGLHPGNGVNADTIDTYTDFGSGWKRLASISKDIAQRLTTVTIGTHGLLHTIGFLRAFKDVIGRKPTLAEKIGIALHDIGYLRTGVVNDLKHPELGAKIASKLVGENISKKILGHSESYAKAHKIPISDWWTLDKIWPAYVSPRVYKFAGQAELFGYKMTIDQINRVLDKAHTIKSIVKRDPLDPSRTLYAISTPLHIANEHSAKLIINTRDTLHGRTTDNIEGLHKSGFLGNVASINKEVIRYMTPFGSGYDYAKEDPHPEIQPAYNTAQDVYLYEWIRASKIGVDEQELYEYMTQQPEPPSKYSQAVMSTGTALHQYLQAIRHSKDRTYKSEVLVYDLQNQITGHIDEINRGKIGDIKSVEPWKLDKIAQTGEAYPMHRAQVMFYLGTTGTKEGYVNYVNREDLRQQINIPVHFDPYEYEALLKKVKRTRTQVAADIARGLLDKSNLPKTASLETLLTEKEPEISIEEARQIYRDELEYLRGIKRGMPKSGPGYERIKLRNQKALEERERKKRETLFASMQTQGIGLQIYNNRNQHYIM